MRLWDWVIGGNNIAIRTNVFIRIGRFGDYTDEKRGEDGSM